MPELPEVETTLRGVQPYLEGATLTHVQVRVPMLRLPTPPASVLQGRTLSNLRRRNKYILIDTDDAHSIILHLGMSGRLTLTTASEPLLKHDHIILGTAGGKQVRLHDPRRFGMFLHLPTPLLATHPLITAIGPEPLTEDFNPAYLHKALRTKSIPIKAAIMDGKLVAGVGNIYASESLFHARINPLTPASKLTKKQCAQLVESIRIILLQAIAAGGSSLRDFAQADGQLGYFQHTFQVYGRAGLPCHACNTPVKSQVLAQRNTFWCPTCQPR
ncbi:MAG: bifunctional DNA-formamidopyrimidine glycosylase/DNA-(apurinic or apyrimidinic site) lyase [Alphaproteobacteria bacterium]|nr:MAG: bifunctional DNA-formamidopyrimidine glycosylase/DNA-(apurinic or apyrimidinic site) lyase [Alphaproteobacteria bacterium]